MKFNRNSSPLSQAFFTSLLFGLVFLGTYFTTDYLKSSLVKTDHIAAVSNSGFQELWCDIKGFFGFECVTDTQVAVVTPVTVFEVEKTSEPVTPVVTPVATTTIVQNVTNQYTTTPVEREIVREVVIRDNIVDTSRFVTRQEYDRQVDAIMRSIENVDSDSSGGGGDSGISDITNESLEDLSDVASMSQAVGDLLTWTGTAWTNIATSSLGISAGGSSQWTTVGDDIYYVDGNVGIGTTSTAHLLTIGNNAYINDSGELFTEGQFSLAGGLLTSDGVTVGVNTTLYADALDVTGTSTFAGGNFTVNADGLLITSSRGVTNSFFVGDGAGYAAPGASFSNFIGNEAGYEATSALYSNFLGYRAGYGANNVSYANFLGYQSGYAATGASNSNFFGYDAGFLATAASYSNFFGPNAGYNATNASYSNYLGDNAGRGATNASYSNFIGSGAGHSATNAPYANFIGLDAGRNATGAEGANFIGTETGQGATNAIYANFIGYQAGNSAANALYGTFIGYQAGYNDSVSNSSASSSIAIGRRAGTGGFSDSIALGHGVINSAAQQLNIGNVLYASGLYTSNTATSAPQSIGRVGIGTNNPSSQLEVVGDIVSKGTSWTARSAASNNDDTWVGVTYGNGLFVAVAACSFNGGACVMTSPDGVNWTERTAVGVDDYWSAITYGNGLFVAVGQSNDRVMTSPDGINWTAHSAAGNNDSWSAITYGNGLFVAVGSSGDRVMTSPDGINWTARSAADDNDAWYGVTYGNGLFVAAISDGDTRAATSPDGINWTARDVAGTDDYWYGVTYGNGLYVMVGGYGGNLVATSPDGIRWTARSAPSGTDGWNAVTYGNGLFVAVAYDGSQRVMTSGKLEETRVAHNNLYQGGMNVMGNLGIGTSTPGSTLTVAGDISATAIVINASGPAGAIFNSPNANIVAIKTDSGTGVASLRLQTGSESVLLTHTAGYFGIHDGASADAFTVISTTTNRGNVGIGTSTSSSKLTVVGTAGSSDIFTIASSTGSSLLTVTAGGNVGIGTSTPRAKLDIRTENNNEVVLMLGNSARDIGFDTGSGLQIGQWDGSTWTDRLVIGANGNVGIGTSSPTAALEISYNSGTFDALEFTNIAASGRRWLMGDGTGVGAGTFAIRDATAGVNRINIDSAGEVGIATAAPAHALHVTGNSFQGTIAVDTTGSSNYSSYAWKRAGSLIFSAYQHFSDDSLRIEDTDASHGVMLAQNSTSWAASSDSRLKENVENYGPVLSRLTNFRAVSFDWKSTGTSDVGIIAQELYEAFPEVVNVGSTGDLDLMDKIGTWSVAYDKLGVFALQGVKELDIKLEDLATSTLFTDLEEDSFTKRFFSKLIAWFGDAANGIGTMMASVFQASEMICVDNECLTADDIRQLKSNSNIENDEDEENDGGDGQSAPITGCVDSEALNYDALATEDDGSCEYENGVLPVAPILGCTDSEALNFNEEATEDDESCEYEPAPVPEEESVVPPPEEIPAVEEPAEGA